MDVLRFLRAGGLMDLDCLRIIIEDDRIILGANAGLEERIELVATTVVVVAIFCM